MFPKDLYEFAWFAGGLGDYLPELAQTAEPEPWSYQHITSDHDLPILFNYMRYTYTRLAEEQKIAVSDDNEYACFDTGLMSTTQEPIYAFFDRNKIPDKQDWHFARWCRPGEHQLDHFPILPEMAHYFSDPNDLVYDPRLEIRVNVEHIIADNKDRFPEPFSSMDLYMLRNYFKGAVESAKVRVQRNYKIAIPQYYKGNLQLLLPLCLTSPKIADLALTIERHEGFYRASTILTLDMAYNNARQISTPDRHWLEP